MSNDPGPIPDDTYLVIRDGRTSSPRTLEQLMALAEAGKLKPDDELVQRVMGGSIPIGSASEQPWFPGNSPPDLPMPAAIETPPPPTDQSLLRVILTDRWWQVRIGVAVGLLVIAGGVLLALQMSASKVEKQARAAAAAYDADLQSRYRSIKRLCEEYRAKPTDPHALVADMDRLLAELYSPRHPLSSESADLHLLVSDMRTEVWESLPRVSRDLAQAGVLAKQAAAAFVRDELAEGDSLVARADVLIRSVPKKLPAGLPHSEVESVDSLMERAKLERAGVLARAEEQQRAEADRKRQEERQRQLVAEAEAALDSAKMSEEREDYRVAMAKYNGVIDFLSKRGLDSGVAGALLSAAEAGRDRVAVHITFTVTVEVLSIHLMDGTFPSHSVDHELRVNGRVVDRITNTSYRVDFTGVVVRVGDKITARSNWKNGFGAVGASFAYCADAPTVRLGDTRYSLHLYEDEISYQVKNNRSRR